ncbi:MAG: dockerin type I repeat-containing protein [Ruminococcus sp.]|nr:dockerin type I repeat-containing protein [Ruminococcus sp.]
MKRLLSILTAAVMTFSPALTSVSWPAVSADTGSSKPAVFDGITCKIDDGAVCFSTDFGTADHLTSTELLVSTAGDFEASKNGKEFVFRPEDNGEYVVTLFVTVDIPEVTFGFSLVFYSYYITTVNGEISVRDEDTYCLKQNNITVSIIPAAGDPLSFTRYDNDIICDEFYLIGSQLCNTDYFLFYDLSDRAADPECYALLIRTDEGDELLYKDANSIWPLGDFYQIGTDTIDYPVIPGTVPPKSLALIGLWHDIVEKDKIPGIIKCKGSKTLIYSIDEDENENLIPDSLVITECPENDINADGEFSVADAVLLEKWLLGAGDTGFVNWRSADLNSDGVLDTFDLCFLKDRLVAGEVTK